MKTIEQVRAKAEYLIKYCQSHEHDEPCSICDEHKICHIVKYIPEFDVESLTEKLCELESIKNESECFWMVKRIDSGATSHKHESYDSAEKEAKRLASTNPGKKFAVLKAVCYFQTEKPEVKKVEV